MKKITFCLILALACTVFLFDSCKKDKKTKSCSELATDVTEASTAFVNNPTEATCEAYVEAIHDYYDGCSLVPDIVKQTYDEWIESTNCSSY